MKNIVVFTFPFQSHINVALKIAKELIGRGNKVIIFTLKRYEEQVKEIEGEFQDYVVEFPMNDDKVDSNLSKYGDLIMQFSYQVLCKHITMLKQEPIDLIIHDYMASWGRFCGEILKKKTASIMPAYILTPEIMSEYKQLMIKSGVMSAPYLAKLLKMQKINKTIGEEFHINPKNVGEALVNRENLNIVTMNKMLQGKSECLDDTFQFVGNVNLKRTETIGTFPISKLENKKVVYISLGTMFTSNMKLFKFCMRSLKDTEYLVVMSIGKGNKKEDLGKIPKNFIVCCSVPQIAVLEHTDVYISHAGLNSVHEAIYYQVPMILFPQSIEQDYIAHRLKDLKCAEVFRSNSTNEERLRNTIRRLENEKTVKLRMKKIAENMELDAVHKAGDLLMNYIQPNY